MLRCVLPINRLGKWLPHRQFLQNISSRNPPTVQDAGNDYNLETTQEIAKLTSEDTGAALNDITSKQQSINELSKEKEQGTTKTLIKEARQTVSKKHYNFDAISSKDSSWGEVFGTLDTVENLKQSKVKNAVKAETSRLSNIQRNDLNNDHHRNSHYNKAVTSGADSEWTDVFGTLAPEELVKSERQKSASMDPDEDGDEPHRPLREYGSRHTQSWYGKQSQKLAKAGKIYEAVNVLEEKMLKEDRVMPSKFNFTVLIGALGRVGYTKKAFQLYNKMKKMGLKPENPTYTGLFNACSNSPWKEDGLQRANKLRQELIEKDITPNLTTYKAMIKAYGVCGDLLTAFSLVDELSTLSYAIDKEVFLHLLMACISDKEAGTKHAIEVWRRMRKRRITPDILHYNLLLRAIRDCGVGDTETANQLLIPSSEPSSRLRIEGNSMPEKLSINIKMTEQDEISYIQPERTVTTMTVTEHQKSKAEKNRMHVTDITSNTGGASVMNLDVPNILNPRRKTMEVVGLCNLDTAEARLALIGGIPGLLSHMQKDGVSPDIKTVTQLIDIIPPQLSAEDDLLSVLTIHKVKPDVDFLNAVIRKRTLRNDYGAAKEVLSLMSRLEMTPTIRTFGCLATGIYNKKDGLQLLQNMKELDMLPTVDIYSMLIVRSKQDFQYKLKLIHFMGKNNIHPTPFILQTLERHIGIARKNIVDQERGKDVKFFQGKNMDSFKEEFRQFMMMYKQWLLRMEIDLPPHPWDSYRRPHIDSYIADGE